MTPEGKVKAHCDVHLKSSGAYYAKPVQNGMGAPMLDYHGIHKGFGFVIETKSPGKIPTARQLNTLRQVIAAGGSAFVIDGEYTELYNWLALPVPNFTNSLLRRYLNLPEVKT